MKIIVFDKDPEKVSWFRFCMSGMPDVSCEVTADFSKLDVDAYVSPANSFGYMNGGIDLAYARIWPDIQEKVQEYIIDNYEFEEVPVGDAFILFNVEEEEDTFIKQIALIVAPTMRIPMKIPPINVYLATRAAVYQGLKEEFKTIAIPGMGTGSGGVHPKEAGWAMRKGILAAMKTCNQGGNLRMTFPSECQNIAAEHLTIGNHMFIREDIDATD